MQVTCKRGASYVSTWSLMAFANPPDVSQKDPKRRDPHLKGHILPVYPIQEAGNIHGDVYLWVKCQPKRAGKSC